jgi:hypothetical protein
MCQFVQNLLELVTLLGMDNRSRLACFASLICAVGAQRQPILRGHNHDGLAWFAGRVAELAHHPVNSGCAYVPVTHRKW